MEIAKVHAVEAVTSNSLPINTSKRLDSHKARQYVDQVFEKSVIPQLSNYIRIPNKSPSFDQDWEKNGYMNQAVKMFANWARDHIGPLAHVEEVYVEGRTPLLLIDIPGECNHDPILLYGHLDKQPEMSGWDEDKGPWTPKREGDRLYGRGAADDGYAMFTALSAITALKEQKIPHNRCVVLIEACEESGSADLPYYLETYKDRIGSPSLIICLDSGCGNYDQLWCTSSLRGVVGGVINAQVLKEGIHSGSGGGVAPESFSVLRAMLDRLEDPETGHVKPDALHVLVSEKRIQEARDVVAAKQETKDTSLPLTEGVIPVTQDPVGQILQNTWEPSLAITGSDYLPNIADAGNVLRPQTSLKLSMRIPPTLSPDVAMNSIKETLETKPPFQAKVSFIDAHGAPGWEAPTNEPWLEQALQDSSVEYFGKPYLTTGEGGSIPFMADLAQKFPQAQFMVTGVLGPQSNAHGPNEFLEIPTAKKLTCCVAHVISEHHKR